jgi:predicted nucleic acid-binding Zn ribbon protein
MSNPVNIKKIVKNVLKKKGLDNKVSEEIIKDKWLEISGKKIYKNTSPGGIKDKKLIVYAKNSVWMQELNIKHKKKLLKKVKESIFTSTIKNIVFRLGK